MRIKNLFFLTLVFATITLRANNGISVPAPTPIPFFSDETLCNEPAPFFFHIVEVGTTWVRYGWAGNAAFKHRIRTYRASDNFLLSTDIVPIGNATYTVNNLPSGTEVYGVINTICADDSNSSEESTSARGNTLIVELVIQGLSVPNGGSDCQFSGSGSCSFSSDVNVYSYFKIFATNNPTDFRNFALKRSSGILHKAYINEPNNSDGSSFDFKCDGGLDPIPNSCSGPEILEIVGSAGIIGTFTTSYDVDSQGSTFLYTQEIGGYTIQNILPEKKKDRDGKQSSNSHPAKASPNPFTEILDVFIPKSAAQQINIQLFNLAGQQVLHQQFPGDQAQYSLSTESLSPGFYLLRIEADGEVQTLKVVKSE